MSSPRTILKNMFGLSAAEFSTRILTVIYSFYLARVLGVEGFGIFGASKNFTLFFMLFASLGLDAIGTREIAKFPEKIRKIVNNILTMRIISGLIVYLLLIFVVLVIDKSNTEKVVILVFGLNILATNTLLNWVFQAKERFNIIAVRSIISNILNFAGIILLIHSPNDLLLTAVIISFTLFVNTFWMFALYRRDYGKFDFEFDKALWKDYLKQGLPIGITFFIIGLYNYQGVVLLNFLSDGYSAGLYHAAFNVLYVATILSSIVQQIFYPIFSKHQVKEEREKVFRQYTRVIFPIGTFIPLFLFVFADKVIYFFGRDYSESMVCIRILMISTLFIYYSITFFSPLLAWKQEKKVVYANLAGFAINFLANIILIPTMAELGASIASVMSEFSVFIVMAIVFYPIFRKLCFGIYLKYLFLALISTIPFMFVRLSGLQNIFLMISSIGMFIALNFLFKTFNTDDIKSLLRKNEV